MEREIAANRKSTCEWRVLWPPFLWRARWLRGWGKISHLFRIICKYIAEMSREHVSLFSAEMSNSAGHQSSQCTEQYHGYSLAPSKAPSRRRQGSSGQEGRGTLALHLLAHRSISAELVPCRHFQVAIKMPKCIERTSVRRSAHGSSGDCSRASSSFSPGVAASSHIAVARDAMTIAVRSFELVELVAETTIAPVVDTSAAAVSRVGSSTAVSRPQRLGMLTDIFF